MGVNYKVQETIYASTNNSKSYDYLKKWELGKEPSILHHFVGSLVYQKTYKNHNSRINLPFVTIQHFPIIFMSQIFIWTIKTPHRIIGCRETDRRPKTPQL